MLAFDVNTIKQVAREAPALRVVYAGLALVRQAAVEGWLSNRARYFDELHRRRSWEFNSAVEKERHRRTLALAFDVRAQPSLGNVLEIGCSEGAFTAVIASRSRSVIACDVSPVACCRARSHTQRYPHVSVEQRDVLRDDVRGPYDVAFAMDVFDYFHSRRRVSAASTKICSALREGGLFVISVWRQPSIVDRTRLFSCMAEGAAAILDEVSSTPGLQLVDRAKYPATLDHAPIGYPQHLIAVYRKIS